MNGVGLAAYLIAAILLGGGPGSGSLWDWPVATSPHPVTWIVPVSALVIGLAAPMLGLGPRLPIPGLPSKERKRSNA